MQTTSAIKKTGEVYSQSDLDPLTWNNQIEIFFYEMKYSDLIYLVLVLGLLKAKIVIYDVNYIKYDDRLLFLDD